MLCLTVAAMLGLVWLEAREALALRRARRERARERRPLAHAQLAPKSFDFLAAKVDAADARRGSP